MPDLNRRRGGGSVGDVQGTEVTDAELEAEALAATPSDAVADDAVSWWDVVDPAPQGTLPAWYMPTPVAGARRLVGWRRSLAFSLIAMFLSINAAGLCFTYGAIT